MKMKKKLAALALCVVTAATLMITAFAAARFSDVPEKAWYYKDVESAVEQGLVNGTSSTTYSPDKNLTYAEAIKLAACMHKKVTTGSTEFETSSPWYQTYVDYAAENGIIKDVKAYTWTDNATRAGYMAIFANAIPDTGLRSGYSALKEINKVADGSIPDVAMSHPQADAIYKLYRAGILQGNDEKHSCDPSSAIKRSEVAAILTRMMNDDKRVSFTMGDDSGELKITKQPASVTAANGEKAVLSVETSGEKDKSKFKWKRSLDGKKWEDVPNNTQYSGADTDTLSIETNEETASYQYQCEVNYNGTYTLSGVADLNAYGPLTIEKQPVSTSAAIGEWATFTVTVKYGTAPYRYSWTRSNSKDGSYYELLNTEGMVKGANANTLQICASQESWDRDYYYRCKITDKNGKTVYTDSVQMLRTAGVLSFDRLESVNTYIGNTVDFTVKISGGRGPYTYKWYVAAIDGRTDWTPIINDDTYSGLTGTSSKTESTLTVKANEKSYDQKFRCEISDASGNKVTTNAAWMNVGFSIMRQPQTMSGRIGEKVSFWVRADNGPLPYEFKWQVREKGSDQWKDVESVRADVENDNCGTLTITVKSSDEGSVFRCIVTDSLGDEVVSQEATLYVK